MLRGLELARCTLAVFARFPGITGRLEMWRVSLGTILVGVASCSFGCVAPPRLDRMLSVFNCLVPRSRFVRASGGA